MQIIAAQQNTDGWFLERAKPNTYTASEANAMMGTSKYTSRTDLLKQKKLGYQPDVTQQQQALFDKGHKAEELARPIVEEIIFGEELYPMTGYIEIDDMRLLAAFDGITLGEDAIWEHKLWNDNLADMVRAGGVPESHYWQLEQQLLVSGANYVEFVVSDGTEQRMVKTTYYSVPARREALIEGWKQFHKDLQNFEMEHVVEPPKAEPIKDLPAVTIQVRGELTLCNLHDVTPMFDKFLREAKTELVTDNDFAQAEAEAKLGRETAKRCKLTAKAVVDQMLSISEVTRTLEEYAAKFDALALKQEKAVKEQKESRKAVAKLEREKAYSKHIEALNEFIKPIKLIVPDCDKPDFVGAMKNQRTLDSLYNKLDTELARVKIAADLLTKDIQAKLDWFNDNYGAGNGVRGFWHLFPDMQSVIHNNQTDSFRCVVESRIAADKKAEEEKLEAERERIRQEEAIKLEQERKRIQAEEERKAKEQIQAEKNRLAMEAAEKERVERETRQAEERKRVAAETKRQLEEKAALQAELNKQAKPAEQKPVDLEEEYKKLGEIADKSKSDFRRDLLSCKHLYEEPSPGKEKLIAAIAKSFLTTNEIAERWLVEEFT